MAGTRGHRSFGYVRRLPSKRWQASYLGPDGARHAAAFTFDTRLDADAWLVAERRLIDGRTWQPPKTRAAAMDAASITLAAYAETWLAQRTLKPRTIAHYRSLIERLIVPTFGSVRVDKLTPPAVRAWWASLDSSTPTQNAHGYALLKAICATAVDDDLLAANPCRVRGAGQARRVSRTEPASLDELTTLVAALPEQYRLMTLLASWCALRFGELIELRRSDLDLRRGIVRVHRAAVWVDGAVVVGSPKSAAGVRDVALPPHLIPVVREHLQAMTFAGRDALLFPSAGDPRRHMRPGTLAKVFTPARSAAGRPDLRFHDLRHTAAVMATATGASLAEVMARLGHSSPGAAMRYQHAARGRDQAIAASLSALAEAGDAK